VGTGYLVDAVKYSIVVPVYNEEESMAELVRRLRGAPQQGGPASARQAAQPPDSSPGATVLGLRPPGRGWTILVERAGSGPWMDIFNRMGLHGTRVGDMIASRIA
jgi:hypothetical protein